MGVERESNERRCPGANAWGLQFTVHRNLKIEIILELSLSKYHIVFELQESRSRKDIEWYEKK